MNNTIKLAPGFTMSSVDFATQGNAVIGIRDAGKTYTAMKAAEELLNSKIPIICYDPVGIWKNLKIGVNGHKGYPVVIAGGIGSDILLNTKNAVEIVRAAMKENVSLVIDLYSPELINKSTWISIVQETVDLLMYENKNHGLRHIFIEEAAEFIPQRLQPQHARVYASIERLARMGRNARLGMTIINQRAEEVNKAILEICALSLIHKQVGKNSIKSILQWLELRQLNDVKDIIKSLPGLKQGECWAIGQSDQPRKIQIAKRNTYHPNPKKDSNAVFPIINVSELVAKIKQKVDITEALDKPAHSVKKEFDQKLRVLQEQNAELIKNFKLVYGTVKNTVESMEKYLSTIDQAAPPNHALNNSTSEHITKVSSSVASGSMRMLKAAAMFHPKPITKYRMAALARLSHSSGSFSTYLSSLKKDELIEVEGTDIKITGRGLQKAGEVELLPTKPDQVIELWCGIIGNESGAARMLRALGQTYPADITKSDLGLRVNMSHTSGSFSTYLSTLKRNGLISVSGIFIKASSDLFV